MMLEIKRRKTPIGVLALTTVLVTAWPWLAPGTAGAIAMKDTLQGLTKVYVSIQGITPALEALGLSADKIRAEAEQSLRRAGFQVLTEEQWQKTLDGGMLEIQVKTYRYPDNPTENGELVAYFVGVRLFQSVALLRKPVIRTESPTWTSEGALGVSREKNLALVNERIRQLVGQFVSEYATVNPLPGPGPGGNPPAREPPRPGRGE
jgi:hypothetical protein